MGTERTASDSRITVLCVDDSPEIVAALRALIDREADLIAVGGVHDAAQFIDVARALKPRIAVVDVSMPGETTPMQAIRRVSDEVPETRVIAYSGYDDAGTQDLVMEAGAWELVSKHAELRVLIDAVRRVASVESA
ncbi:MAG TPA: response regulator transcription factor [Phycisphaerales bacterium]